MDDKIEAYKKIKPIVVVLMCLAIVELGMLAFMIGKPSAQLWLTLGVIAITSLYMGYLCLKLISELLKNNSSKK